MEREGERGIKRKTERREIFIPKDPLVHVAAARVSTTMFNKNL
jgi:hypothetical protein